MKYKIIKYCEEPLNFFKCEDKDGRSHNLDLFTDASYSGFGRIQYREDRRKAYHELEGKFIEVVDTSPYIEFALGVTLLKEKEVED